MIPKQIVPCIVLAMLVLVSVQSVGATEWDMEVTVTIPEPVFTSGDGDLQVSIEGMVTYVSPGCPLLPIGTVSVDIPHGQGVASYRVVSSSETIRTTAGVGFAGDQSALSDDTAGTSSTCALLSQEDGETRFAVSPLEIVDGALVFHRSITFMIDLEPIEATSYPTFDTWDEIIIAAEGTEDEFQRLADWKGGRSANASWLTDSRCLVVELDDIVSDPSNWGDPLSHGGSGNDTATQVRNFITRTHTVLGADTYLLGGDVMEIPARSATFITPETADVATDQYYSCLDGDWDGDGDGDYGEVGEADLEPDVLLGRAPVDNADDVRHFVDKVMDYELTCVGTRSDEVIMVANKLNSLPLTWGGDYKDIVADSLSHDVETLYERDGTYGLDELVQALDASPTLVNHMGHGQTDRFGSSEGYFTISDAGSLTNDHPFVLFSQACHVGGFQEDDCLAEVLVTSEHGAAATITNTHYGWYDPGGTDAATQNFDIRFFSNLADANSSTIGGTIDLMRADLLPLIETDSYHRWSFMSLNLLGDPGMFMALDSGVEQGLIIDSIECDGAVLGEGSTLTVVVENPSGLYETGVLTLDRDCARLDESNVSVAPHSSIVTNMTWVPVGQPSESLVVELNTTGTMYDHTDSATIDVDVTRVVDDALVVSGPLDLFGDLTIAEGGSIVASSGIVVHGPYDIVIEGSMAVHSAMLGEPTTISLHSGSLSIESIDADNVTVVGAGHLDIVGCDLVDPSIDVDGVVSANDSALTGGSFSASGTVNLSNVSSEGCPLSISASGALMDVTVRGAPTGISSERCDGIVMGRVLVEDCDVGIATVDCGNVSMIDVTSQGNGRDLVIGANAHMMSLDGVHTTYGDVVCLQGNGSVDVDGVAGAILNGCSNVTVMDEDISVGLWVHGCDGVEVTGCDLMASSMLRVDDSTGALVWGNDMSTDDIVVSGCSLDNGYPLAGNHWVGLTGPDLNHGIDQDVPGADGLVDEPMIMGDSVDRYPLVMSVSSPSSPPIAGIQCPLSVLTLTDTVFTSMSTDDGHIVSWSWDLGDGTMAEGEVVTHSYGDDGTYRVTLTVIDDKGMEDDCGTDVQVLNRPPRAMIFVIGDPVIGNRLVIRSDVEEDDGDVISWQWDLGDGTMADGNRIGHVYADPGEYRISLTVTDDDGATDTATLTLTIFRERPMAAFECPTEALTGEVVRFTDASIDDGGIVSWQWDLGDGTFSTEASPVHAYEDDGVYEVTLTVTDGDGMSDSASRDVTISNRPPEPSISIIGDMVGGREVRLIDSGDDPDGNVVSRAWYLDDIAVGTGVEVQVVCEAGDHSVLLVAEDDDGSYASTTMQMYVEDALPTLEVTPPEGAVTLEPIWIEYESHDVEGDVDVTLTCAGATIEGDTVLFPTPGEWVVLLTANDSAGNVVSAPITIEVANRPPTAEIGWEQTSPLTVVFHVAAADPDGTISDVTILTDGSSYDGTGAEHRYGSPGIHAVTVIVHDGDRGETVLWANVTVTTDVRFEDVAIGPSEASFRVACEGGMPDDVAVLVEVDGVERATIGIDDDEVVRVPLDLPWGSHDVSLTLLVEPSLDSDVTDNSVTSDVDGPFEMWFVVVIIIACAAVMVIIVRRR